MLIPESTDCNVDESRELVNNISKLINESLGRNIFVVDIRGVSTLCDFCVVAEGRVDRHVKAIAKKHRRNPPKKREVETSKNGRNARGNWVF